VNRRAQIAMSAPEVVAFLQEQRTVVCATIGPRGFPHLMPLWYVVRDAQVWAWTFARSQKVRNLEREPRATLQVYAGESYTELRGVMIESEVLVHRDPSIVAALGAELLRRYAPAGADEPTEFMEAVRAQARKRVALQFIPMRTASWDHRKLAAGVY
jgi:general stress protein 26